jgi:ubiquinone/menaquinone biosynthesis C-methylase UbiE
LNFDPVAPYYDRLERWFSRGIMNQARTAHLASVRRCREALLLGEGPGRFLPLLLKRFPAAKITCVDSSARMLALARSQIPETDQNRVSLVEADVRLWSGDRGRFDLITTHFFLDCFNADELESLIPKIAFAAASDARWLIADFSVPPHGFARWRAIFITGALYQFFRLSAGLLAQQLICPQPWLERSGFHLHHRLEFDLALVRSDCWTRAAN